MIPISDFSGPDKISHSSTECKAALFGLFFFWSTVNAQLIGEQNFSPVFIRLLRFSHKSFWGYKGDYIIDSKGVNSKLGSYSKDKWGCLWTWRSFILTHMHSVLCSSLKLCYNYYPFSFISINSRNAMSLTPYDTVGWILFKSLHVWYLKNNMYIFNF